MRHALRQRLEDENNAMVAGGGEDSESHGMGPGSQQGVIEERSRSTIGFPPAGYRAGLDH